METTGPERFGGGWENKNISMEERRVLPKVGMYPRSYCREDCCEPGESAPRVPREGP